MDLSIVNNDYYLSGMAALIGDIDSKKPDKFEDFYMITYLS
jgi:hypothetical protein